jgi:RNA polymerase sigma-70 factor, ECF subfamily
MSHVTDPRFTEIESHRTYLVRYALSQLRDAHLAEEAVQEALLAALEGIGRFDAAPRCARGSLPS